MTQILKNLSDDELLIQTKLAVEKERKCTIHVIEHLAEVESRRLYSKLGFSSLWDYVNRELGYCSGSAQRRINAMRFSKQVPEVKASLESAKVTLSSVSMVQQFCRNEQVQNKKTYTVTERKALLEKIEHKTSRQTEQLLREISPLSVQPRERERVVSSDLVEIKFTADHETLELLNRLKEVLSGSNPNPSTSAVLKRALKVALEKLDPKNKKIDFTKVEAKKCAPKATQVAAVQPGINLSTLISTPSQTSANQSRAGVSFAARKRDYISVHTKRVLFKNAAYQCAYVSALTGARCTSKRALQIEHKTPHAKGGSDTLGNLSVLCSSHNLYRAVEEFGGEKFK